MIATFLNQEKECLAFSISGMEEDHLTSASER